MMLARSVAGYPRSHVIVWYKLFRIFQPLIEHPKSNASPSARLSKGNPPCSPNAARRSYEAAGLPSAATRVPSIDSRGAPHSSTPLGSSCPRSSRTSVSLSFGFPIVPVPLPITASSARSSPASARLDSHFRKSPSRSVRLLLISAIEKHGRSLECAFPRA
jgi:hypothetical protein